MRCPVCDRSLRSGEAKVVDVRPVAAKNAFRRRRVCVCGARISTLEVIVEDREFTRLREQLSGGCLQI